MLKMTRVERALQIWQVLIAAAQFRQILTYEIVSEKIYGKKGAGTLAQDLGVIMRYCKANGLPPLTVLAVNKKTGQPGVGLTAVTVESLHRHREAVYGRHWFQLRPVGSKELEPFRKQSSRGAGTH